MKQIIDAGYNILDTMYKMLDSRLNRLGIKNMLDDGSAVILNNVLWKTWYFPARVQRTPREN